MKRKLIFVHVGKAGGGTIQESLQKSPLFSNYKCERVHYRPPQYNESDKYLFVLRNPVDRVISAYYWRKHFSESSKKHIAESAIFRDYPTIDSLLQDQENIKKLHRVSHVDQGFAHHFRGMDIIRPDQILAVLCTHTLNSDLKEYLNIESGLEVRDNKSNQQSPSDETLAILTRYCEKEYIAIENLLKKYPISDEKRKVVLKKWK